MKEDTHIWDKYWKGEDDLSWWKRPAPEVAQFIATQSPRERPMVLDLGCGLGRHAIAFAQAGFSVLAIDSSEVAVEHLVRWADELSLEIRTQVCDLQSTAIPECTFDIVLGYNVIYHGYRNQFAAAITRVRRLLKERGLFYFTCPTRSDGKYGFGEEVAPHTFLSGKSVTPGDMHYFPDEADLRQVLQGFRVLSQEKKEGHWNNKGEQQFYSTWHILAERLL